MMNIREDKGQVLVLTVLGMTVLMGFLALAIDMGTLFRAKRNMQIAADAAAMAAATQLYYGGTNAQIQSAAYAAATANGVDHTATGNTVTVTGPGVTLASGTTCATCVEVQLATPNPTFFMTLFTGSHTANVAAMAVAGAPGDSNNCVWLMDPSMGGKKGGELDMQGKGSLTATGCTIYLNSNSASAVSVTGNPSVTAKSINIVGPDTGAVGAFGTTPVNINVAPQTPDIPQDLSGIPSGGCSTTSTATEIYPAGSPPKKPSSSQVSDSSVGGSSAKPVICFTNKSGVTVDAGVTLPGASGSGVQYVFEYGVSLNGAAQFGCYGTLSPCTANQPGSDGKFDPTQTYGATLDIAGGGFSQGNSALTIYAPTSGSYNSIALMQPMSNTTDNKCPAAKAGPCLLVQRGNSGSVFDGIIFAPGEYVELQDQAGAVYATGLIAKGLYNKTSNLIINNYSQYNPTTTPFTLVTLVE